MVKKDINGRVFKNAVNVLDKYSRGAKEDQYRSTGIIPLDLVLSNGRGFPVGKVIEIAGMSTCGKSTLCLSMCKYFCDRGAFILYIVLEGGLSETQIKTFGLSRYYRPFDVQKMTM